MTDERLTGLEEIWQDDSHLSGVALVAAADGQDDLLPADALEHLGDCLSCNERLGEQAVLAMVMHESLVASRSSEVPQTAQVSWRLLAASAAASLWPRRRAAVVAIASRAAAASGCSRPYDVIVRGR